MNTFLAIVLVCPLTLGADACDEAKAIDVLCIRVENELGCTIGWQEIVARSGLREGLGETTFLKTLCRRARP